MIHEIKGFAKKKTLDIIDTMKSRMIKFDGRLTAGKFAAKVKTSNAYHVPILNDNSKIDQESDRKMTADLVKTMFKSETSERIKLEVTGGEFSIIDCRIIEYNKTEDYGWHLDFTVNQGGLSQLKTNKLSFVLFLSNPNDYSGGELEIELETEIKSYKCSQGTLLIYPSDRLHKVNKITKGNRLVVIGWIYCLYENPLNRYIICKSDRAMNELFDHIHNNKKVDLQDLFNTFMLLNAQYKKLSLTNH